MSNVNITASMGSCTVGHYVQTAQGSILSESDARSYWALVGRGAPDACWLWRGALTGKHGYRYGRFGVLRGGRVEQLYAHRLAFELTHGPLAPGLVACHRCDTTKCCNPAHLFAGTQGDNLRDASRKGHFHVPRPTAHKVTTDELNDIDALLAAGMRQIRIAERYGVTKGWVSQYVHGLRRRYDRPAQKAVSR